MSTGSTFALATRDRIIDRAYSGSDPTINALQKENKFQVALTEFGWYLILWTLPNTIGGLGAFIPYPVVAYRGWFGGIVSVDGNPSAGYRNRMKRSIT